ncbi:hypothetical protein [Mycolicibacterium diernhoferi]|uniref:Uncharacterized protein n=1 Tax=Mycolicibacterium diernhoferi TaxID=1801 RepID=A0A1Q4HC44_9MYCO|nr:hypothetical protein [Mycolicibacterium diernhoferi]OJZ65117.1 hypothetical protein BRW64_14890 [Mycolicibacterium diernhoferi]OPE46611.1 hypothetical protein BV510_26150 [Mycolicibacterium diernhoferi]PEG55045.1 hypothetical protein CRI78_07475 [Mycolicibacterium diernhoferi]QYL23672.1 hypothetical protein K0O62_04980 [Mycolicibacterium diernhoferi]
MTVYGLDLGKVHQAIRATLAERVLPGVTSGDARAELLSVVEMLDSLQDRLAWDAEPLSAAVARSRSLSAQLGQRSDSGSDGDDLDALYADRASIGDVLKSAYTDGFDPAIAAAVAEFTAADIAAEISPGLRPGLPG